MLPFRRLRASVLIDTPVVPNPDPLVALNATSYVLNPEIVRSIPVKIPPLKPTTVQTGPGNRDEFEEFAADVYEWFSLLRLGSPRLDPNGYIDPYLSRYQVPGTPQDWKDSKLARITWTGFLTPTWAKATLIDLITAIPSRTWCSLSSTTFSTGMGEAAPTLHSFASRMRQASMCSGRPRGMNDGASRSITGPKKGDQIYLQSCLCRTFLSSLRPCPKMASSTSLRSSACPSGVCRSSRAASSSIRRRNSGSGCWVDSSASDIVPTVTRKPSGRDGSCTGVAGPSVLALEPFMPLDSSVGLQDTRQPPANRLRLRSSPSPSGPRHS